METPTVSAQGKLVELIIRQEVQGVEYMSPAEALELACKLIDAAMEVLNKEVKSD